MGLMIGGFDGTNESDSLGNTLSPVNYRPSRSNRYRIAAMEYEEPYSCTLGVVKDYCNTEDESMVFSEEQINRIMRWLIRDEGYCVLRPVYDNNEYEDVYYRGYFTATAQKGFGGIVGFELEFTADSPYAYRDFTEIAHTSGQAFHDISDKTGYLYADLEIACRASGDLKITNSLDPDNNILIRNVQSGDVYKLHGDSKVYECSRSGDSIYNDFNYNFLRICNTYQNQDNVITASLSCDMKISYTPVRRVGIAL